MGHLSEFTYRRKSLMSEVFIETGTFKGTSTWEAIKVGFPTIHTIEVSERLYKAYSPQFAHLPHVYTHLGSSPAVLNQILDRTKSTTIWLDAHFQGYDQDEQDPVIGQCPLTQELQVIFSASWQEELKLIIDDAMFFNGEFWRGPYAHMNDRSQFPTLEQIRDTIPIQYSIEEYSNKLYVMQKDQ